jgi:hypothetical protein
MLLDEPLLLLLLLLDSSLLLMLGDLSLRSCSPSVELLPDRLLLALASLYLFLPLLPRADRSLAGLVSLAFFFLVFSRSSSFSPFPLVFLAFLSCRSAPAILYIF